MLRAPIVLLAVFCHVSLITVAQGGMIYDNGMANTLISPIDWVLVRDSAGPARMPTTLNVLPPATITDTATVQDSSQLWLDSVTVNRIAASNSSTVVIRDQAAPARIRTLNAYHSSSIQMMTARPHLFDGSTIDVVNLFNASTLTKGDGIVWNLNAYDQSRIIQHAGTIPRLTLFHDSSADIGGFSFDVVAHDRSAITVGQGIQFTMKLYDESSVHFLNNTPLNPGIGPAVHAYDSSSVKIDKGVYFSLSAADHSQAAVRGGVFRSDGVAGSGFSITDISGGIIPQLSISESAVINLRGGNIGLPNRSDIVMTSGLLVIYGSDLQFASGSPTSSSGRITGILQDGTPLDVDFDRTGGEIRFVAVPAPSSWVLTVVGALVVGWRCRRRQRDASDC